MGAPAAYLHQLPAPLAGINLQYGLTNHRAEQVKTLEAAEGRTALRAVCQNRNLWGVEDFQEISIRHSKYVANRFAHEAASARTSRGPPSRRNLGALRRMGARAVGRQDHAGAVFLKYRLDTPLPPSGRSSACGGGAR